MNLSSDRPAPLLIVSPPRQPGASSRVWLLNAEASGSRLLWNAPVAISLGALALAVTAGIVAMQLDMRADVFDPLYLPIFYRLFLFEDYTASFVFVGVLLLIAPLPAAQQAAANLARAIGRHPLA